MATNGNQLETEEQFQEIITRYPTEQRYIMPIMHDLRNRYHYLPRKALEMAAAHLQVPLSRVYSVATFSKAFSLIRRGRVRLKTCDGTTCHIKGSQTIIEEVYKNLGIRPGETTPDREFSLETVNCIGACAIAPALIVNDKVYGKVTAASLKTIIREYGGRENE